MNQVSRATAAIPFPAFPAGLVPGPSAAGVGLRRFGTEEDDLGVDFARGDPAGLVTRLLGQCLVDPEGILPPGFFRDLSVGKRLECLLTLAAGGDTAGFHFPFHCAGCGQEIELELTLDEIAEMQSEADLIDTVEIEIAGETRGFRKPLGRDQERWAGMTFIDEGEAASVMIGTLAVHPFEWEVVLPGTDLGLIDEKLDEADPLVNFLCDVGCGECGQPNEFRIDLCEIALSMLARSQKQLIVMVHKLATHYHWSEKEIFAVPHWRRIEYLDLIAAGR